MNTICWEKNHIYRVKINNIFSLKTWFDYCLLQFSRTVNLAQAGFLKIDKN